jgi:hypothetical protein
MLPSTRTPGMLKTGIWRPGRNRPAEFAHDEAPPQEGRDALKLVEEAMKSAGREMNFAPLDEIADMTLEGIKNDDFWIYAESGQANAQVRVDSMLQKTPPDYMRQASQFTPRAR